MTVLNTEQQKSLDAYTAGISQLRDPVPDPVVAFFGTAGSYTEQAAIQFFGKAVDRVPFRLSEDVFKSISRGKADYGVLPIENSTTGSIAAVYDALAKYSCFIIGETQVKVEHCLLGLPGAAIDQITEVYSHAQGFEQSAAFLSQYPHLKCMTYFNTAVAAAHVAKTGDPHLAAIASRRAADLHGLSILKENISNANNNVTRFVIVAPAMETRPDQNKISLVFHLPHTAGSLYQVLEIFNRHQLNLCKIESRPIVGHHWEYLFFLDFMGLIDRTGLDAVMQEVIAKTEGFHFLGCYKQ